MCTNFKMKPAADGSVVVGRSMEFPVGIPTSLGVLPKGFAGKGAAPAGQSASREWTATHGVVGMVGFGNPHWLTDGMNTAGVSMHALYMPIAHFRDHAAVSDQGLIFFSSGASSRCATSMS